MGKFEAAVHRWQRRLELMDWQIDIIADIEKAHDGEIGEHAPHVTLDALPAYKRVSLFYAPDEIKGEEDVTACHEMIHLICEPLRDVAEDALNHVPGRQAREVYGRWTSTSLESVVSHLTRLFYRGRRG